MRRDSQEQQLCHIHHHGHWQRVPLADCNRCALPRGFHSISWCTVGRHLTHTTQLPKFYGLVSHSSQTISNTSSLEPSVYVHARAHTYTHTYAHTLAHTTHIQAIFQTHWVSLWGRALPFILNIPQVTTMCNQSWKSQVYKFQRRKTEQQRV